MVQDSQRVFRDMLLSFLEIAVKVFSHCLKFTNVKIPLGRCETCYKQKKVKQRWFFHSQESVACGLGLLVRWMHLYVQSDSSPAIYLFFPNFNGVLSSDLLSVIQWKLMGTNGCHPSSQKGKMSQGHMIL